MAIQYLQPENSNYVWIDILNPTKEDLQQIHQMYGIHEYMLLDCLESEHLPKFEKTGNIYFFLTRENLNPRTDILNTNSDLSTKIAIFVLDNILISVHRLENDNITNLSLRLKQDETDKKGIADIVYALTWKILHSFDQEGILLEDKLGSIEKLIFLRDRPIDLIKRLYHLKRRVEINLRILIHSREWVYSLLQLHGDEVILQDIRDLYTKLINIYELISDRINNLLNIHLAISAQRNNDTMRMLAIISMYFLPITFMAGLWGMNFHFMPEIAWKYGYLFAIFSMMIICVGMFFYLKYKGINNK